MSSLQADSASFTLARKAVGVVLCVLAVAAISSCSSGSKPVASSSNDSVAAESTTTTTKAKDVSLTPDGVAQHLADAGLGCTDFIPKIDDPTKTKTTFAPEPVSGIGSCTVDGTHLTITVFASKSDEAMASAQLKTLYAAVAKSLGITELTYIHAGKDDRIWLSVSKESGGDKGITPEQEALLKKVAKGLNGKVVKVDL